MLNVLFCFDSNYYYQAYTTIYSILENVSEKINIYIIHDIEIDDENFPKLICNHEKLNSLKIFKFEDNDINFPNLRKAHLSAATYYRLFLDYYLPNNLDQIIYLDTDIVCIKDPIPIFKKELKKLKESKYLISAKTEIKYYSSNNKEIFNKLNMNASYFNAGVLLIDFKSWRELKISNKLINHMNLIHDKIEFWDQDVMNSYFNGQYLELDYLLNFNANINISESSTNLNEILLLHYIGSKKPWLTSGLLSYPETSNFYHVYFSKLFNQNYHITHKWRRASLIDLLKSILNLKLFRLNKPFKYFKEILKSFRN